jgi:hypothetical protein
MKRSYLFYCCHEALWFFDHAALQRGVEDVLEHFFDLRQGVIDKGRQNSAGVKSQETVHNHKTRKRLEKCRSFRTLHFFLKLKRTQKVT